MGLFPGNPKKIRARIRSYERSLRKELAEHNFIHDGSGKRYLLGPLYMLMDDKEGALQSYAWFEVQFPDDVGEPMQYLCWTLALYHDGGWEAATQKLRQTMLSNLYIISHLLGREQAELDIWHGSSLAEKVCLESIPSEIFALWDEADLKWVQETYDRPDMVQIRERYIEIYRQFKSERPGPRRSRLVEEAFKLRHAR